MIGIQRDRKEKDNSAAQIKKQEMNNRNRKPTK